jgi:hypothetical protein
MAPIVEWDDLPGETLDIPERVSSLWLVYVRAGSDPERKLCQTRNHRRAWDRLTRWFLSYQSSFPHVLPYLHYRIEEVLC